MKVLQMFLVSFVSITFLYQCGGRPHTNRSVSTPAATPSPVNPDQEVRAWYQFFERTSPRVHKLPFRLPDSPEREIFQTRELEFIATDRPLGGHPNNDIGDQAREALRRFIRGLGVDDLFYNGEGQFREDQFNDPLGHIEPVAEQNRREAAARQWVINKFFLRKAASESVRQSFNTTPPLPALPFPQTLVNFVQSEFESLKNELPEEQKARLAGFRTSVGSPPNASVGENLWLKQTSNVLWISPFLIRGLLLQSVQKPAEDEFDKVVANPSLTTHFLDNPEVRNAVTANFKKAIRYLLVHCMGHVTLVPSPGVDKEVEIDNFAFSRLASKDTGPFLQFLDQAVLMNEDNSAWGVEVSGDGKRVSARIKSLQ